MATFQRAAFVLLTLVVLTANERLAHSQAVTDGDTLRLEGKTYRLWGIDAPESSQYCPDGWPAGRMATTRLQELIKGKAVICQRTGSDRYGRTIAICRASGRDLGAAMVREGLAWAYLRYSDDYAKEEKQAQVDGLGVHKHGCQPAWEWRAKRSP